MSDLFHLLRGLSSGVYEQVQKTRDINRQREDKELDFARSTLENMASRPDFDSAQYASLLNYMHSLSQPRPAKKGVAGIMGQHEALPISQMIATVTHGDPSQPFKGDPTQTTIADDKLKLLGGGGPSSGTSTSGGAMADLASPPEPPASQSPAPRLAPPPLPMSPAPAAAATQRPALQPQPPASLPQPPGTSNMLQATNDMAMDQASQAAAPKPPQGPGLPMPPGLDDKALAAARTKRPQTGVGQMFRTPDEMNIQGGRTQFTNAMAASGGRMEGMRQELRQMLNREPTSQELLMYSRGVVARGQMVDGFVTNPDGTTTPMTVEWNPVTGAVTDIDTGASITNFTRTTSSAMTPNKRLVTQPDGTIKEVDMPRIGTGNSTVSDVSGVRGRQQFVPVTNVQDYDQVTGQNVNRLVPHPVVSGSVPPQSAPTSGAGSQGTPNALPAAPPSSRTAQPAGNQPPATAGERVIRSNPRAKFSDQQKGALSGIASAERFAQQALDFIKQNHLENDNLALDAKWNNFLYNLGVDPGETEKLIQSVGIAEPKAILGQMGGQRGQYWGELLARHTAQASNSYALMAKKLQNMITIGEGIKQDINKAALMVPTTGGPQMPGRSGRGGLTPPPVADLSGAGGTGGAKEGDRKPIPGIAGGEAEFKGGRWIRVK